MADRHLAQRILTWAVLPMLVLGIGMWFENSHGLHLGSAALAADMSQAEFEKRVRDYLLEHPEVVGDALNRLEAKQGELDAAASTVALKSHAAEVFQDPDSPVSGNPKGDVTLVEFFDYNCPYCRSMAPFMTQAEATDPQLRIVYKEFPILGPGSVFAAKAALAANKQGKYVAFHSALYQVRGEVDEAKVAPGLVYQDANVKVSAVENTHFNFPQGSPPYGKYRSYSYRFDTLDRVVVFTGDTGPSDALTEFAKGADVLVTEVILSDDLVALYKRNGIWQSKTPAEQEGNIRHLEEEHITPEVVGKMAAKAGVKTVLMTHLVATVDPNDDYQRYVDGAKKYFSGPIVLAKDLMQF